MKRIIVRAPFSRRKIIISGKARQKVLRAQKTLNRYGERSSRSNRAIKTLQHYENAKFGKRKTIRFTR